MADEHFPKDLQEKIQNLLQNSNSHYQKSYDSLSNKYRTKKERDRSVASFDESLAYAVARLPSTFYVFSYVLSELKKLTRDRVFLESYLDIGSGPGAAYWAIREIYPEINHISLLENNPFMYALLENFMNDVGHVSLIRKEASQFKESQPYDMTSFSYSLGEMPEVEKILDKYWAITKEIMVITEPGTPQGFQTISKARDFLLKKGGYSIAPCGHNGLCPLEINPKNWCHFSIRVHRSEMHKQVKKATLTYEDEKFSYLIVSKKNPSLLPYARILTKPLKGKGHVRFDLCRPREIERKIISKSNKMDYKMNKNKAWGDMWP